MSTATLGHPAALFPSFSLPALGRRDARTGAAIAVSLLIHGMALGWLPGMSRQASAPLPPLVVRLASPEVPAARIAVAPAPTPVPESPPRRREAVPVLHAAAPTATARAAAVPAVPPPIAEALAETVAAPPAVVAQPAVAARPAPAPDAGQLAAYGRELAGAVAAHQRYPRLAQLRQWQGTAVLQLDLAAAGSLLGIRVLSSSGHEVLDRQALEMVREALPLPPLPAALAGRPLTVDVPVVFRLAS
jgi:protein TonB